MHEIDRSFRARRIRAAERQAQATRRRAVLAALMVVLGVAAGFAGWTYWPSGEAAVTATGAQVPGETAADKPPKPVFVNPIIDLAGDPLIIRFAGASEAAGKLREVDVSPELRQTAIPDQVEVLSDVMLSSSERIMALPSKPEDFAFFQSQSARGRPVVQVDAIQDTDADAAAGETVPADPDSDEVLVPVAAQDDLEGNVPQANAEEPAVVEDGIPTDLGAPQSATGEIGDPDADMAAGWGETVGGGQEALPSVKKTAIADTTTVQLVKPDIERYRRVEDLTVTVKGERPLEAIISEYGFGADDAKAAAEAARRLGLDVLGDRFVIGLRGYRTAKGALPRLAQVSVNEPGTANVPGKYRGTVALGDDGTYGPGADPWIGDNLSQYADRRDTGAPQQSYRLLDAIYSTATRNNVPSSVTGEAIMLVSRAFDLQALATREDRLVMAFARDARGEGGNSGRVLYVAVHGVDRNFECFVYQPQPGADFACMSEKDATHSVTVTNGMVTPVAGVLTSTFGPRQHPILKQVRIHKGVDWGAPLGTPIMAAFDGTIAFAGDGNGYGNVIRIDHGGGKATAYAHMSRFADGMKVGLAVHAGEVIGYVGTTGLSTGPHLHFELYQDGVAVDPLGSAVAEAAPAAPSAAESALMAGSDGSAVELLVNRIVHVESGGNARAKNPLSTAAGLGQFIKSTWMRMMKTYRPDLFRSMSVEEILELRYEPTIAREMVANLARENEARLRSYGHSITAGRLYLAHFLGPEGAHQALAAPSSAMVADVLGAQVISANPFLTGKDCAYVVAWAEKKMTGKAVRYTAQPSVTTKTVVRTSPEFIAYRETMLKLVELADTSPIKLQVAGPQTDSRTEAPGPDAGTDTAPGGEASPPQDAGDD